MTTVTPLAIVFVAAAAAAGCAHHDTYQKPLTPVRVQAVESVAASNQLRYSAAIEPKTRVDLAFKVGGYIRSLGTVDGRSIDSGDRVSKGMVLARIQPADYDNRIAQARSQLTEATAASAAAKSAFDRASALFTANSLTRPEFEQAQTAYETVQAKVAGARALVQQAESAKTDSALESPIDGIVLKRLVEVGSLVGPGTGAFVLADVSAVKAVFGAPDTILGSLKVGGTAPITSEAVPNRAFTGKITNVAPSADPRSRVFDVELTIPNADRALKPGMLAVVAIEARGRDLRVPIVPLSAIVRSKTRPDGYAVYVLEESGGHAVARLHDVSVGEMSGNGVAVLGGLRGGEKVIVSGATIVNDGEAVSVIL
jgi:RND family efflux transporter MFP subunit